MEWILQKAQGFWAWLQGLNLFGQIPLMVLASLLSLALLFYIFRWRAKITEMMTSRLRKWTTRYWSLQHRTLLEPLILSGFFAGIFIWIFWEALANMKQDAVRNLILLTAGVIGFYFLYQRTKTADQTKKAAEKSAEASRKNTEIAEQGLTTERLTRAIEQLAHEKPSVRLGGILGLEQIAKTHQEERKKIARVLASFIRTRATKDSEETKKDLAMCDIPKMEKIRNFSAYRAQRLDVEDAIKVLANIASEVEKQRRLSKEYGEKKYQICDLQNTDLRGLNLIHVDLSEFDLTKADMRYATLFFTNFSRAHLVSANFHGAEYLISTKFNEAYLGGAIFIEARIEDTDLTGAKLKNADFTGAVLKRMEIGGATLKGANLTCVTLMNMYGLEQHQLDKAFRWQGYEVYPMFSVEGHSFMPPPEKEKPIEFEFCISPTNGEKWEIYKDNIGEWRWLRVTRNNEIAGSSNEGYKEKADCIANAKRHGMDCELSQSNDD